METTSTSQQTSNPALKKIARKFLKTLASEGKEILSQAYDDLVDKIIEAPIIKKHSHKETQQCECENCHCQITSHKTKEKFSDAQKWELMRAIDPIFVIKKSEIGMYYPSCTLTNNHYFDHHKTAEEALQKAWEIYTRKEGFWIGEHHFGFDGEKFIQTDESYGNPNSWEDNISRIK